MCAFYSRAHSCRFLKGETELGSANESKRTKDNLSKAEDDHPLHPLQTTTETGQAGTSLEQDLDTAK